MVPQNIAETPLNISGILKNFKSFIRELYQNFWTQNLKQKKEQNNYFRAEISPKEEELHRLKVKKKIDF